VLDDLPARSSAYRTHRPLTAVARRRRINSVRRRLIITAAVLLLLAGIVTILWDVCDWPPPRLILKYGLPPAGVPTGERRSVLGVEFVEMASGYVHVVECNRNCQSGSFLGRISAVFGLSLGRLPDHFGMTHRYWQEFTEPVWISLRDLPYEARLELLCSVDPDVEERDVQPRDALAWLARRTSLRFRDAHRTEAFYLCERMGEAGEPFPFWFHGREPATERLVWIPAEDDD